jgi:hypothetical protein
MSTYVVNMQKGNNGDGCVPSLELDAEAGVIRTWSTVGYVGAVRAGDLLVITDERGRAALAATVDRVDVELDVGRPVYRCVAEVDGDVCGSTAVSMWRKKQNRVKDAVGRCPRCGTHAVPGETFVKDVLRSDRHTFVLRDIAPAAGATIKELRATVGIRSRDRLVPVPDDRWDDVVALLPALADLREGEGVTRGDSAVAELVGRYGLACAVLGPAMDPADLRAVDVDGEGMLLCPHLADLWGRGLLHLVVDGDVVRVVLDARYRSHPIHGWLHGRQAALPAEIAPAGLPRADDGDGDDGPSGGGGGRGGPSPSPDVPSGGAKLRGAWTFGTAPGQVSYAAVPPRGLPFSRPHKQVKDSA